MKNYDVRIKLKRDTEENWLKNNPILYYGEMAVSEKSNGEIEFKVGDGVNRFSDLKVVGGAAAGEYDDSEIRNLIADLQNNKVDKVDGYGLSEIKSMGKSQIPVEPPIEVASFILQDGSEPTIEYYSTTTLDNMLTNKVDKANGMGLCNANFVSMDVAKDGAGATIGVRNQGDGFLITYENFYTKKGANEKLSGKQDKTTTTSKTDVTVSFDLKDKNNCFDTYVSVAATNVSISISDGEYPLDYTSSLSFKTSNTAPQTSYTANSKTLMWVGSECTVSGSSSVFAPMANKIYDIVFYFNGINFVGLVNGYDNIPQQGA